MTAALLAAALLTPDSPELPAEPKVARRWRGASGPMFIELTDGLLLTASRSGRVVSPPWRVSEVLWRFGPLREVPNV